MLDVLRRLPQRATCEAMVVVMVVAQENSKRLALGKQRHDLRFGEFVPLVQINQELGFVAIADGVESAFLLSEDVCQVKHVLLSRTQVDVSLEHVVAGMNVDVVVNPIMGNVLVVQHDPGLVMRVDIARRLPTAPVILVFVVKPATSRSWL